MIVVMSQESIVVQVIIVNVSPIGGILIVRQ